MLPDIIYSCSVFVAVLFCFTTTLFADTPKSNATPVVYTAYSHEFPQSVMDNAYARLCRIYVLDLDSRQCVSAKNVGAEWIEGKVELSTNARLLIRANAGNRIAVLGFRNSIPKAGAAVSCMAVRSGAVSFSIRNKDREMISIPQYRDVTMTFNEFVGFLRNGQHFPETPELYTRPGRKRLFATERTLGSKVEQLLKQSEGVVVPPSLPPTPSTPYESYGDTAK